MVVDVLVRGSVFRHSHSIHTSPPAAMAYNRDRDWDYGKEQWQQDNEWAPYGSGYNYSRDEDANGDGKRRKFNNGNYEPSDSGGYGAKKRQVASEPSPHVIFLGLDPDFTEADLQAYLTSNGCDIETVTIIRDRSTGSSKGFGFAQFASSEHARAFVDPLFPYVQIPPPASHGASATGAYYKALETGAPHNGRRVKIDYSQSAAPHEKGGQGRTNTNDGTRDIGTTQSSILLFRGLDPLSGVQAIQQAMKTVFGHHVDGAKGLRRILLIKDKITMASFGFAFVEFIDTQSAASVLAATMSPKTHPTGFRISDRPVAASFAHPYSFQPVENLMLYDDARIPSSSTLGGGEGSFVRYWDENATVVVLEFEVKEKQVNGSLAASKEKKPKKKVKDVSSQPLAASVLPLASKPVTFNFGKGALKATPTAAAPLGEPVAQAFADESHEDGPDDTPAPSSAKAVTGKKVAPLISSKKTVKNISKWNQVQEQLTSGESTSAPSAEPAAIPVMPPSAANPTTSPLVEPQDEFEFSDIVAMSCFLCARQFKSSEQLHRHNTESDLHKKNLRDTSLQDIARQKAVAKRNAQEASSSQQPKYRDRASERRVLFQQPDAPMPENQAKEKRRFAEGPPTPPRPASPPPNPGADDSNVGNKMLKLMGWTTGTGLGTTGEGRVDPIETAMYAPGVGLGAGKAKEIGKHSETYLSAAQHSARERYTST